MALVLFQSMREKLENRDDLTESEARRILLESIELIPDIQSARMDRTTLYLQPVETDAEIRMPVQDAVDSLIMVWNDYMSAQFHQDMARNE